MIIIIGIASFAAGTIFGLIAGYKNRKKVHEIVKEIDAAGDDFERAFKHIKDIVK